MKFIHTADLHLGYKFSSQFPLETLEFLKENQKKILSDIIDLGIKKEIDALFIAGDLFDTHKPTKALSDFVIKEFERAGFPIFIICGNHDPKTVDSVYEKIEFPENVHIYSDTIDSFKLGDANIYGTSFIAPHKSDSAIKGFSVDNEESLNILLAHGDIAKESYYNPMKTQHITDTRADYVALGHIHMECDIKKDGNTYFGYSGAPQGSTFKENGDFFVILGDIEKGFLKYEKIDLSRHAFKSLEINIDMPQDEDDIIKRIKEKISSFNISKTLFDIKVTGFIKDGINPDINRIENELKKGLLYLRLKADFTVKYDIELLKEEESIRGEFVRNALKELEGKDYEYILKVIEYGVSRL